ncbi:Acetyl-coenzyme A synthetase 1 [Candidatus Terasakiella magnetica]|uniref:Acetyl-coenzyme A synthetase 1 n=2 Tax=Candidatus Terasakiella magnetica TaxID=1867952 RepID=A0A1C3RMH5_9PROT|nr:Acetyl-coenzyme A synthetase 1 [Candidatus Terasakiella magnetica]
MKQVKETIAMNECLWTPSPERIEASNLRAFMKHVNGQYSLDIKDYDALHDFSVHEREKFWVSLKDFAGLKAQDWGKRILVDGDKMPGAQFFPDAKISFAENLLKKKDESQALIFWGEDKVKRAVSWKELNDKVSVFAQALRAQGVSKGDRVCAFMPNMPETIIAMLAVTSLGAVWSSTSPDFGVNGVLDRFGQIEPTVLVGVEGYHYNGKAHDCLGKLEEIVKELPTLETCVIVPYTRENPDLSSVDKAVLLDDFVAGFESGAIEYEYVEFNHPLYIMFSSGTTGKPKCIVHGTGGTLLKQVSEHILHCDNGPTSRVFYFTTCGWMMWNWLVAGLAAGSTLLLYDGSPFYPSGNILFDFADAEKMTMFGTSAKYIDALNKADLKPLNTHDLSSVQSMTSTGSPLVAESFDYAYEGIKKDIHLASISGGTDILGCFVLGNPIAPVYRGEIQCRALGMAVETFDDDGQPIRGDKGELVCTKAFPSMPVKFWNDPDNARYKSAYFEKYDNIWCHGDFVAIDEKTGGMVIYGRSDATLNPGGVRIGTAEIYRQVEALPQIQESIVIGQDWEDDVRVVLFVVMKGTFELTDELISTIKSKIRSGCTPRHVPAKVIAVADIPRTKSGKITELAVRDIVHGREVKNKTALANPEALELYKNLDPLAI